MQLLRAPWVARLLELLRYVVTGTLSALMNLLIVMLLTERFGLHYLLSLCVCFVVVTFVSFWLNRGWTFRKRGRGATVDLSRYATVMFVQIGVAALALSACVELLHIPYPLAMLLLSVVFVPITYALHRRWSFGLRWFGERT